MTIDDLVSSIKSVNNGLSLKIEGAERTVQSVLKCSTKIYPESTFYLVTFTDGAFIEIDDSVRFCDGEKTHVDRNLITDFGEYLNIDNKQYLLSVVDDRVVILETLYGEADNENDLAYCEYRYTSSAWRFVKQNGEDAYDLFLKDIDLKNIEVIRPEA